MKGRRPLGKGEVLSNDEFLKKVRAVHGEKFDLSLIEYSGSKAKVKVICKKHGIFYSIPSDLVGGTGCRKCANDSLKRWSIDDDQFLKDNYKERGAYWCAEVLNKSDHAVRGRVAVLKLTNKQRKSHSHIPSYFWSSITNRVKQDGYILDFDEDFVWELYKLQNGKCALTGWDICFSKKRSEASCSLDRIDSNGDYTKDNVQLTHKIVNRCKLNCEEGFFYKICKSISINRPDLSKRDLVWEWDVWNDTERPVFID